MGYIKCCVPMCRSNRTILHHRFPNPKKDLERYHAWINAINPLFFELDPMDVYKLKRVCHLHFKNEHFSVGSTRVHRNAVPTQLLPLSVQPSPGASSPSEIVTSLGTLDAISGDLHDEPSGSTSNQDSNEDLSTPGPSHGMKTPKKRKLGSTSNQDSDEDLSTPGPSHDRMTKKRKLEPRTFEGISAVTPHTILRSVGINIRKDMTPKKHILYAQVKNIFRKLRKVSHSKENFRKRLFAAEKFAKDEALESNLSSLNFLAIQFIKCQVREASKPKKLHRFTVDEKILALTLYNHSPKSYRFLARVFTLPSKSTLNRFLQLIQFKAGINLEIFEALKRSTEQLDSSDKYVSVLFDEMAVMPSLYFNEADGYIQGFEDMGEGARSQEIADHVLIFMVRGLKKKFKQPLCYTFSCKGGAKASQIKKILKQILELLLDIGLKPITTICDQTQVNVSVVNSLLNDTKANYLRRNDDTYKVGSFEVRGFKVFPIYDPPHLLKGIRNNFLIKWIEYEKNGEKRIAKWSHIISLYEIDNGPNSVDGLRALPHLTAEHVYSHKIKKMKVKHAAQVFSHRLASTMHFVSNMEGQQVLDHGDHTAEVLRFFDRLFDSVNGNLKLPSQGKTLRCGISEESAHLKFWREEALPFLDKMKFITAGSHERERPPSLENWSFTINNIINIWNTVKVDGFNYLLGRHLNQDPIENLFGQIRSHGIQNSMPTPSAFIGAFKAMCVNSTLNLYNPSFNCEKDDSDFLYAGLKSFLKPTPNTLTMPESLAHPLPPSPPPITLPMPVVSNFSTSLSKSVNNYVAGFLLKSIKKKVLICANCKHSFFCEVGENPDNILINAREYGGAWKKRLCYPTTLFAQSFDSIVKVVYQVLKNDAHNSKFSELIVNKIKNVVNFNYILCNEHREEIINYIIKLSVRTLVHAYCQDINKIITGRDTREQAYTDPIKAKALEILNRRKKCRNLKKIL